MTPIRIENTPKEISRLCTVIYRQILSESDNFESGNYTVISSSDLKRLFELYDQYFFDSYFQREFSGKISFRLSKRMTKSGGKVERSRSDGSYRISLSSFLIFRSFSDDCREIKVNGVVCRDRLEATMRILEHEIVHLLEMTFYGESSCKKRRFKEISNRIFGHTDVTHQLVTQPEAAHRHYNLHAGDTVAFKFDNRKYTGVISRINKRATVMVRDKAGHFRDSRGRRYAKYYIPLPSLEPVND